MGKKKHKHRKIALLTRSKLNSIEKIISITIIDSDISHDEFTLVINEEQNYFRLKESKRAKDNQLGNIEPDRLTEQSKRIGMNKILKQNEGQSLKLKTAVQNL